MKNKEFKKGIAIGVAATLVVTGAVFTSYQKVLFPKGNALSDVKTVQKLNYLEELIDEEYLDEKDESSLREGLYAGLAIPKSVTFTFPSVEIIIFCGFISR